MRQQTAVWAAVASFLAALTGVLPSAPCLPRQEMDSLQRQVEAHTVTVHESLSSWTQGDPAASCAPPEDHANPRGDTEQHGPSRASGEGLGAVTAERPHPERV